MSHFPRIMQLLMRCSSDEDLQVGVVSRSGERRRNSDNILPVTVCCWAMDRNIGEIGCFKIVKFWQLTKGFVWNQIFLQPRLPSSQALQNGLKALKILKHVSRSDLLCFQGSSRQTGPVFMSEVWVFYYYSTTKSI